jgi:glycosyltransferase involved in cell wall biosynthesis
MDYSNDLIEILIIDGASTDNTLKIVSEYITKFNNIKLYNNPKRISPIAFNIGIKNSSGDYIILMSAHSKFNSNYFKILTAKIIEFNADLIGGYSVTKTITNTKLSNAIVKVMMNKYGLGGAEVRTGVDKPKQVDTVTGMFRKSIFNKVGLFNESLVRNQDMELSRRITASGGKIFIIPDVSFTYYARDNFKDLWINNFRNGMWIPITVYITKKINSLSIRHFIPMVFLLSLVLPLIAILISPLFSIISIVSFTLHFILIMKISFSLNDKNTSILHLIITFYTLHLSYGIGSLIGLFYINKLFK